MAESLSASHFDAVTGFNKMPGLNVYFAADPCFEDKVRKTRGRLYRLGPRYRTYAAMEKVVFDPAAKVEILLISDTEKEKFMRHYHTPEERFHSLPPGISKDRVAPADAAALRAGFRRELNVGDDEYLLLMVGSGFKTKGLDRSLLALASLPEALQLKTKLYVIGNGNPRPFEKMAKRLGIGRQVKLAGGRDDVQHFMLAADLLLHPSYTENTGTVLVEALASGLPVLASAVCGYGFHVECAKAGMLIPSPFRQETFNAMLLEIMRSANLKHWKINGMDYISRTDVFSLAERAADVIEAAAYRRNAA
jgi:UDP-glucose:(heptosyl)LPS alpha-1,3-glucosyltransferase